MQIKLSISNDQTPTTTLKLPSKWIMFFVVCNLRTREFQTEEEAAAVTEELKELIYHSEKKS